MFSVKILSLTLFASFTLHAGFEQVANRLDRGKISFSDYPGIIKNLVQSGFAYSAIPWAKEVLATSSVVIDQNFDRTLDGLLEKVGTNQFETMPEDMLSRSGSNYILYTVAKKVSDKKIIIKLKVI